jgi:hypothetical protein
MTSSALLLAMTEMRSFVRSFARTRTAGVELEEKRGRRAKKLLRLKGLASSTTVLLRGLFRFSTLEKQKGTHATSIAVDADDPEAGASALEGASASASCLGFLAAAPSAASLPCCAALLLLLELLELLLLLLLLLELLLLELLLLPPSPRSWSLSPS